MWHLRWWSQTPSTPRRLRRWCFITPRTSEAEPPAVDALQGGQGWREAIEAYPESERHLATHEGHLVKANPRDEPHVGDLIPFASSMNLTCAAKQIPDKIAGLAALGVTELVYQPAGSDIERELRAFGSAAGLPG